MSHETCLWLNRLSILFAYISFWFVAPEFIGEARLLSWQYHAKRLVGVMIAAWALGSMAIYCVVKLPVIVSLTRSHHSFRYGFEVGFFPTRSHGWILIAIAFVGFALLHWGDRLVKVLADRSKWRAISFAFGAILFTISCCLQLASTVERAAPR